MRGPARRYGLRVTLFAVAVLLVALPFTALVVGVLRQGPLVHLDRAGLDRLHRQVEGSSAAVVALQAVSFVGSPVWLFLLVVGALIYLAKRGRPRLVVFLVVTSVVGALLGTAAKEAVDRPRPSLLEPVATAHGSSFPSGHALNSTVVYGALLLLFLPAVPPGRRRPLIAGAVVLVLGIGFSRLALGVHYVSDVAGGFVLGAAWLSASVAAFSIWRQELGGQEVEPTEGLEPEAAGDLAP
jgi:undecaprenyl-diphosphatase